MAKRDGCPVGEVKIGNKCVPEGQKSLYQLKKELREWRSPRVFINKNGYLTVIYHNKEVLYKMERTTFFKKLEKEYGRKYTTYDSVELCKGSGYREIHYQKKPLEE